MSENELGIHHDQAGFQDLDQEKFKRIKAELLMPFSNEEINEEWKDFSKYRGDAIPPLKKLYNRYVEGYDYSIRLLQFPDSRVFEFQISDPSEDPIAKIMFIEEENNPGDFKMSHRLIKTDNMHISGTEFLKQTEDYINIVRSYGYLKVDQFSAATSQQTVINWLSKNGFEFVSEQDRIAAEDWVEHPERYEKFYISNGRDGYLDDPFVFKKSEINRDKLRQYIDDSLEDHHHLIDKHGDLLRQPGAVRIHLKKSLNSEVAKPE